MWCLSGIPHVLKLLRNHFLDHGFVLPSGTVINKDTIRLLLDKDGDELKIAHKLTPLHLTVTGMERQKVRLAAQLFSRTTASAIRYVCPEKKEMADFIELVNDSFDVLNSRTKTAKFPWQSPYGMDLDRQNNLLDSMSRTISELRVGNKTSLLPFQRGFMMSIAAVKGLFQDLQTQFDVKYLLTARLNQDCLENFFSQLRGLGHHYDDPTPIEVKYRFRLLLFARNSVDLNSSNSSNVQRDTESNAGQQLDDADIDDIDIDASDYLSVQLLKNVDVVSSYTADDMSTTSSVDDGASLTELTADDIDRFLQDVQLTDMETRQLPVRHRSNPQCHLYHVMMICQARPLSTSLVTWLLKFAELTRNSERLPAKTVRS